MKTAILCILLSATLLHAASIPNQPELDHPLHQAVQNAGAVEPGHKINKRFITGLTGLTAMMLYDMMDDDDYFDDLPLRRRRPSRRTVQLAQMIRQLAGPGGLTRGQVQNMQQNLQSLQAMQNLQQLMQVQNLQNLQASTVPPLQ